MNARGRDQKRNGSSLARSLLWFATLLAGACSIPIVPFTLTPVPRAGDGAPPIKAQVRRVAVTDELLGTGGCPDTQSRLVVEVDVYNADAQRTFDVGVPEVRTQAAAGGPVTTAGVVSIGALGLPSKVAPWVSDPGRGRLNWTVRLAPGQGQTFSVTYDRLSSCDARGPLRAMVSVPVARQPPLEMVLVAPVESSVRWHYDRPPLVSSVNTSWTSLSGSGGSLLEPIGWALTRAHGRLVWGQQTRFGLLYRDTLASAPPALVYTLAMHVGWFPWRFPVGVYASAGVTAGFLSAPRAYRRADGGTSDKLWLLPRTSVGLAFPIGSPLTAATLLPVEPPGSPMRRLTLRLGYMRLFNTEDRHGTSGFELAVDVAFGP